MFVLAAFSSSILATRKNASIAEENCPEEIWHEWKTDLPIEKPLDVKPPAKLQAATVKKTKQCRRI
ncbi:MAG: hypothetical protein IPI45_14405 [Saprospiraceae bacterium]|nr:hypothetical protein [Saprospiraceae bacterium]